MVSQIFTLCKVYYLFLNFVLSTRVGWGVKKVQKFLFVVIECPLLLMTSVILLSSRDTILIAIMLHFYYYFIKKVNRYERDDGYRILLGSTRCEGTS